MLLVIKQCRLWKQQNLCQGWGGGDSDGLRDQNINLAPTGGKKPAPPLMNFLQLRK